MGDIIFITATLAFFAICVAYVNWCDRIIGPDEFGGEHSDDTDIDTVSATANGTATSIESAEVAAA